MINDVECKIILPALPPPSYRNVVVFQCPYEMGNDILAKELSAFGNVQEVRFQKWSNMPDVCTGTHILRITLLKPIPRFISVQGVQVNVWFKGQPIVCDICKKKGHCAASYSDKGKCFHCHEAGHLARHCTKPWGNHSGPPAPAPAAEVHPHTDDGVPPLIHAKALDLGFEPLSGGESLAEAASVVEAVLNDDSASSVDHVSVDEEDPVSDGEEDPVSNGEVAAPLLVVDERFNQLDQAASQSCSPSILLNCGPVVASSGGESVCRQLVISSSSSNNSSVNNVGNGNNNNDNDNVGNGNSVNDSDNVDNDNGGSIGGNVNFYVSVVTPYDASASPGSSSQDSDMSIVDCHRHQKQVQGQKDFCLSVAGLNCLVQKDFFRSSAWLNCLGSTFGSL